MTALQLYRTEQGCRIALVVSVARKWMQILVIEDGRLRILRAPVTEQRYMTPLETNQRKAIASLRRLARKRGTSRAIRTAIAELVQS